MLRRIKNIIVRFVRYLRGYSLYLKDVRVYNRMLDESTDLSKRFVINKEKKYPCVTERWNTNGGIIDSSYFLSTIDVAGQIIENKPDIHYDIGSTIEHFISKLLAAKIPVTVIDIRPFPHILQGLSFIQGNAMDLNEIGDNSVSSLSCIYAMEHYGLGRYGDPIDPDGWIKGLLEMQRILALGGYLYIATSVGKEDVLRFNAHRVFDPNTVIETLDRMVLIQFSYVEDWNIIKTDIKDIKLDIDETCGIFVFCKK